MNAETAAGALIGAYSTILMVELVGDKSLYAITSLSLRFKASRVMAGVGAAFMMKMLAAVLFGRAVSRIPFAWATLVSGVGFAASAVLALRRGRGAPETVLSTVSSGRAAAISFSSVFFAEWGDPGQFSAAALAAQTGAPAMVWFGGTLALLSKATVAAAVGRRLGSSLPARVLRLAAGVTLCGLAAISIGKAVQCFLKA